MILFAAGPNIKFRVERIEVLAVQVLLNNSEGFAETGGIKQKSGSGKQSQEGESYF